MGMRYLRESQVIRCFFVRPDQKDAKTQLMTHAIQITASNSVGQVAVQPLQTKANHWRGRRSLSGTVSADRVQSRNRAGGEAGVESWPAERARGVELCLPRAASECVPAQRGRRV